MICSNIDKWYNYKIYKKLAQTTWESIIPLIYLWLEFQIKYIRLKRVFLQQELMLRQTTTDAAMDPFLSGINEQHARQESADSGLGLGSAYSLPHTPEDFLANIDDNMDGTSGR